MKDDIPAIVRVIKAKNLRMVTALISLGIPLTGYFSAEKDTLLHIAIEHGTDEIVKLLLNALEPSEVNEMLITQNTLLETPVFLAVYCKKVSILKLLLDRYPASQQALIMHNKDGKTPLHQAVDNCSDSIIKILIDHGADPWLLSTNERQSNLSFPENISAYALACYNILDSLSDESNLGLQSSPDESVLSFLCLIILRHVHVDKIHSFVEKNQPVQNILLDSDTKAILWKKSFSEEITLKMIDKATLFANNLNGANYHLKKILEVQEFRSHAENNFNTNKHN